MSDSCSKVSQPPPPHLSLHRANLDPDFLVDALLLLFLFAAPASWSPRHTGRHRTSSAPGCPFDRSAESLVAMTRSVAAYSSESGVIFFSSISSSAKVFLYFSQLCPVAEG